MLRIFTVTVALSLTLTTIAEARDGGERTGPPVLGFWFPVGTAEAATAPALPDPVSLGRNAARAAPADTRPEPLAGGLHGRNARFADA